MFDPFERAAHRRGIQRRSAHAPVFLHRRESRGLQNADMFRHAGKRHVEPLGELADRALPLREAAKNLTPGRVGEGEKRRVEVLGTVNHMV